MSEINEYPNESLIFQDEDYYDIDFWNGVDWETKKILGETIKAGILAGVEVEKHIDTFYATTIEPAGGNSTWNGVTQIQPAPLASLNQRYKILTFTGIGQTRGCYINSIIPSYFIIDNMIKVDIVILSQDIGDTVWQVGLTKPSITGNFGGLPDTEWQIIEHTMIGGFAVEKISMTFDGTDLVAGDPIALMVFRDKDNVLDTMNADAFLNTIKIEQS